MNSIIFISGSSEGIGLATALKFAQDLTNTVLINSRKQQKLNQAKEYIIKESGNNKIETYAANFTNINEIEKVFNQIKQKYKKIDILINNIALSLHFGPILQTTEKAYDKMMTGNLKSYFFTTKKFLEIIPKNKNSSIIFMSSYAGKIIIPEIGIYSINKTAITALGLALAKELNDDNIRVNCISPGLIKTKLSKALLGSDMKIGQPKDVANLIFFICSEQGKFINGANLMITGDPLPSL